MAIGIGGVTNRIAILIDANAKGAIRELDQLGRKADQSLGTADTKMQRFADTSLRMGAAITAASAVAGVGLYKAAQGASHVGESINKVNVLFGRNGREVVTWSKGLARSFGLSSSEALEAAGNIGSMLRTSGQNQKRAADMSKALVELAGDMSSFNEIPVDEALEKLQSGLAGQARPLRSTGILLSEARVKAYAFKNGIAEAGAELTEGQKVTARYGLILKDAKFQVGDFANTLGFSLPNQQKAAAASLKNFSDSVGEAFLPVVSSATDALSKLADGLVSIDGATGGAVGKIGTIGTVAGAAVGGLLLLAGGAIKAKTAFTRLALQAPKTAAALSFAGKLAALYAIDQAATTAARSLADKLAPGAAEARREVVALGGEGAKALEQFYRAVQRADSGSDDLKDFLFGGSPQQRAGGLWGYATKQWDLLVDRGDSAKDQIKAQFRAILAESPTAAKNTLDLLVQSGELSRAEARKLRGEITQNVAARRKHAKTVEEDAALLNGNTLAQQRNADAVNEARAALDARRLAVLASFNSEIAAAQSVQALSQALGENAAPLDQQAALLAAAGDKAKLAADQYEAVEGQTASTKKQTEFFRNALIELSGEFPALSGVILGYIARLDQVPPEKNTKVTADTSQADGAIAAFVRKVNRLPGVDFVLPAGGTGGRRAAGGPVSAGHTYLVGEQGPEIFTPSTSGQILNAQDSAAKLRPLDSRGGGAYSPTYVINAVAMNPREVVRAVEEHERRNGPAWRRNN